MITVHNITKYYGQVRALDQVSFDVQKGEIVGLLGPNGSGKTTLMRILTGFFPPTEGKVIVAGLDIETHPLEARRRVGYLPESVVLYPDMTVRTFLEFAARIKGDTASQRKQQVARVLGECGIEHMAHRHIGTLSKGYRQRVGFAQALLCDPEILILDEPTVGLDPHQVIEMRELVKGMGGKTTVLLSSHILSEVGLTCHRVVIIDKGKIIAEDTAAGLSERVQGATRVFVRVAGPQAEVLAALRLLPGVKEAQEAPETGDGQEGHGFLATSPNTTIAKDIAQLVIDRRWALHELRPVTLGLEELFVRLTTDQTGQAAFGLATATTLVNQWRTQVDQPPRNEMADATEVQVSQRKAGFWARHPIPAISAVCAGILAGVSQVATQGTFPYAFGAVLGGALVGLVPGWLWERSRGWSRRLAPVGVALSIPFLLLFWRSEASALPFVALLQLLPVTAIWGLILTSIVGAVINFCLRFTTAASGKD